MSARTSAGYGPNATVIVDISDKQECKPNAMGSFFSNTLYFYILCFSDITIRSSKAGIKYFHYNPDYCGSIRMVVGATVAAVICVVVPEKQGRK